MTDKVLATYEGQQEIAEAIRGINLEALTQKAVWVDSVADMRELDAPQGITVATRGYYEPNDGGNGFYYIRAKEVGAVDDGGSVIFLDNDNEAKLITDGIVNVKQFGAKGDGTTDDTTSIQSAVDFGKKIIFPKATYKSGQINVTRNIEIDFCESEITATEDVFLNCTGEVVATLTSEANYTYNQVGYAITDAEYSSYTGYAFLRGENNFEKARTYYCGGFACQFTNGIMEGSYPIDVTTNVKLDIVNPITVRIHRLGNVSHVNAILTYPKTYAIKIVYGLHCVVDLLDMDEAQSYMVVALDKCLFCQVKNSNVEQIMSTSDNNSYLVGILNSSFCTVEQCSLYNKYWSCTTTGDKYLNYHNCITRCKLISDEIFCHGDHDNGYYTQFTDNVCSSAEFSAGCYVDNITVLATNKTGAEYCNILLQYSSDERNAVYTVKNVRFDIPKSLITIGERVGIQIKVSPQGTSGNTYYIRELIVENVNSADRDTTVTPARMTTYFLSTENYVLEKIYVKNTDHSIYLGKSSSNTNVDITNYVLELSDCITSKANTIGGSGIIYNIAYMSNIGCSALSGTFAELYLCNINCRSNITTNLQVTSKLCGNGLSGSRIVNDALLVPTYLKITDMKYGNEAMPRFNLTSASNGKKYWQKFDSTALDFVTEEITSA